MRNLKQNEEKVKAHMGEVRNILQRMEPMRSTDTSDNPAGPDLPSLSPSSISANPSSTNTSFLTASNQPQQFPSVINIESDMPEEVHIRKITSDTNVDMYMNNVHIPVLIDTGCEYTLLPRKIFDKTGLPYNPIQYVKLVLASGKHFIDSWLVGPVHLTFGEQTFKEYILVAESGLDALLGMNFINSREATLCFKRKGLILNEELMPFNFQPSNATPSAVAVRKCTLLPNTCKVIEAKLDAPYDKRLLCESKRNRNLVVAPSQYEPGKPLSFVMCNWSKKPMKVYKASPITDTSEVHPLYHYDINYDNPAPPETYNPPQGNTLTPPQDPETSDQGETSKLFVLSKEEILKRPELHPPDGFVEVSDEEVQAYKTNPEACVPQHIWKSFEKSIESGLLDDKQSALLAKILTKYESLFQKDHLDVGCITGVTHKIETGNAQPIKVPYRRTPLKLAEQERETLNNMLDAGIVRPSTSPWSSPPVLVRKQDGTLRYACDYRLLNSVTVGNSYPIPAISDCLDYLQGNQVFTKLDAASGF